MIKPLDFVRPKGTVISGWSSDMKPILKEVPTNNIGIVTEISLATENYPRNRVSIDWLDTAEYSNGMQLFNAWWEEEDLIIVNSLPNLLAKAIAHPFGDNAKTVDILFPIG